MRYYICEAQHVSTLAEENQYNLTVIHGAEVKTIGMPEAVILVKDSRDHVSDKELLHMFFLGTGIEAITPEALEVEFHEYSEDDFFSKEITKIATCCACTVLKANYNGGIQEITHFIDLAKHFVDKYTTEDPKNLMEWYLDNILNVASIGDLAGAYYFDSTFISYPENIPIVLVRKNGTVMYVWGASITWDDTEQYPRVLEAVAAKRFEEAHPEFVIRGTDILVVIGRVGEWSTHPKNNHFWDIFAFHKDVVNNVLNGEYIDEDEMRALCGTTRPLYLEGQLDLRIEMLPIWEWSEDLEITADDKYFDSSWEVIGW